MWKYERTTLKALSVFKKNQDSVFKCISSQKKREQNVLTPTGEAFYG